MKRILLLTIALFYFSNLQAQLSPTDSLELAFNNATSDTARLSVLLKEKTRKYIGQADKAITLYIKGEQIAQKVNDKKSLVRIYHNIGVLYAFGKTDEGTAIQWYQKALKQAENINDTEGCALCLYAIGIVYDHQGYRDKMYQVFEQSLAYIESGFTPLLVRPLFSLQSVYHDDKRYKEAITIAKKTIALMERFPKGITIQNQIFAYSNLVATLKQAQTEQENIAFYSGKIRTLLQTSKPDNTPEDLCYVARTCFDIGENTLGIQYANQLLSLKQNDELTIGNQADIHEVLAQYYEEQKNYPLSIQHYKLFMDTRTKVLKNAMTEEAGRKVIKAEAERDLLLKQKEADNNRWWAILGFSLTILVLGGGVIVYRFYKREQERKREVDAINATKDKLFSIIAHDLRSPIGTLKSHLTMTNYGMMSQAEFATASQKLTNNVNALFQTLENLLQWAYSQLKGIKTQAENIHLNAIAETEIKLLSETAHQKNISIVNDIDPSVMIYADANQMALIIRNLVSNSLKFTHSGGKIVLNTKNIEEGKTMLTITDNGIGMPQELQKQLFSIQNKTSRQGTADEKGQGLGLILVKEMVEANQGTLSIESSESKGTVINIQLPRL